MLIKQLNRSDPDKIFIGIENKEGATLNRGELVEWDTTNTLGVSCEEVDSNRATLVAGVVEDTTIASNAFGLVQIWGFHDAVLTADTLTIGVPCMATTASSVGKATDFTATTTVLNVTTAGEIMSIIGVPLTDNGVSTSAGVMLKCM